MDIIGFKNLINKTIQKEKEIVERTEYIKLLFSTIINELSNDNITIKNKYGEIEKSIKISHFSDSIVLSVSLLERSSLFYTLNSLQFFLLELLKHKILLRGSIVIGDLYHDNNTVFGPALNKAYDYENRIAIYPRVIIQEETILEYLQNSKITHDIKEENKYIRYLLQKDLDGYYFIDYFNIDFTQFDCFEDGLLYINHIRNIIIENIKNFDYDAKIKKKNTWLKNNFNKMLVSKNKEYGINFQKHYGIFKIMRSSI